MRILYIHATMVPPPPDQKQDRFLLLSEELEGDILQPVWFRTGEEIEAVFGPGSFPVHTVGRFRYHWFPAYRGQRPKSRLETFWFYVRTGFRVCRERKTACIVVYSHLGTALCGVLLKILTGTKLVPEVATAPETAYLTHRPDPNLADRVKHLYSDVFLHIAILMSDRVHLLYPTQLSSYPLLRGASASVFHEFVPVSKIDRYPPLENGAPYIALVGSPWFLKGADLLIEAFLRIAPDFPALRLKIIGHPVNLAGLEALAKGSPSIDILKATPYAETLRLIGQAEVLVLPSRSEGMGRVLIEGMATGVPLLGSDAGGIPFMIRQGENGFVVRSGDSRALEESLRRLLSDSDLRRRMGEAGYRRAHEDLNETVYVDRFAQMVRDAVQGAP